MKKLFSFCLITFAFITSSANASEKRGGFISDENTEVASTVIQAKKMVKDSFVILEGKITKRVGDEKYLFEDKTGTIIIEIDDDVWKGLEVRPKNTVRIRGEVDTHMMKDTDIDVKQITLID